MSPMRLAILSRKSRLYSNREIRRAAKDAGHDVTTLDPVNLHFFVGDSGSKIFDRSRLLKPFDALIPRVQPDDAWGLASIEHFALTGCFVLNPAHAMATAHDKFASLQMLTGAGLPVPPTVLLKHPLSVKSAIREVSGYPAVFKPLAGAQGMGVILVNSQSEADSLVGLGWEWGQPCILQKFYPEASGEDARLIVLGNKVIASMRRVAKKGEWRANFHRGGKGNAYTPTSKVTRIAIKAARTIGLDFCGVDILDTNDGPVILEVNASPGVQEITRASGVDVAGEVVRFLEGRVKAR